jgi:hypothetical protein
VGRTCSKGVENSVLRGIFLLWVQVSVSLIKMVAEKFCVLQIVPHFIKMRISFMSHVTCMGGLGKAYNVLVC